MSAAPPKKGERKSSPMRSSESGSKGQRSRSSAVPAMGVSASGRSERELEGVLFAGYGIERESLPECASDGGAAV